MTITNLFETKADGTSPMMGANINISIRKTKNGAQVSVNGVGAGEEYSVERQTSESDHDLALRVKNIIITAIEA